MESRIQGDLSVRFGGEFSETCHSNMVRRRGLSQCNLVKEGEYENARFFIRYFQPDGVGELRMDDGTVFKPNDLYPLNKTTFRLYYTSHSTDQQVIDVYIEDNFGQIVQKTFSFQNDKGDDEPEEEEPYIRYSKIKYNP